MYLDVPAGKTLTIAPGATIKGEAGSFSGSCGAPLQGCTISVEGTLSAVGTVASPITFTSFNDNSIGGLTGNGTPRSGEWSGISTSGSSGAIDLEHTNLSYAATGVLAAGGTALLSSVNVASSDQAINVSSGKLSFRGALSQDLSGIRACNWGSQSCSVDAAYTYWGTSAGPFPSGGTAVACGAVTTSPYLTAVGGSSTTGSAFGSANCDGSATPDQRFAAAQQAAATWTHPRSGGS